MWRWLWTLASGTTGTPSLQAVATAAGEPYREDPHAPPMERTVDPCTLPEVLAALRDAGLSFRPHRRGFELCGSMRARVMAVRVRDPRRVTPEEMSCSGDAPELLLDLALALVPLFGPMLADVRFAGTILVDGTRDRGELGEEAAQRIQQMGRRVAMRAPATFSILLDLQLRLRQQR